MKHTIKKRFVTMRTHEELKQVCTQKDIQIASLESLLADRKREARSVEEGILRSVMRTIERKLELVLRKRNGI